MRREVIDVANGSEQTIEFELNCDATIPWSLTVAPVTTATGTAVLEGKNSSSVEKWFALEDGTQDFTADGIAFYRNGYGFKFFRVRLTGLAGSGDIHIDTHNVLTQRV